MFGQNKTLSFGSSTPTTQASASPFGSSTQSTGSPSLSFGFGARPTTTTAPSLFGSTSTATTQASTGFGGFGLSATPATTTQSSFSFGGFGSTAAPTTTTASSGFSFGASSSTGLFGAPQTSTASTFSLGGGFGQPQAQTQPQSTGLFSFNQPQTQQQTAQQAQQAQAPQGSATDQLMNALVYAQVFNDERDIILSKWNQLQAFYGTGKIFFQNQVIDVKEDNPLTRFKTIGYSCKPSYKNEDGLVGLIINQADDKVKSNEKNIVDTLAKIFQLSPSMSVEVESIKALSEKTEFVFYLVERAPSGQTRRIGSMDVFNHMNKPEPAPMLGSLKTGTSVKQQLESLGVISVYPLVTFSEEQEKAYLEAPPPGLNPILWEQAKKNNPNSKKLLPIPINGFKELNKRFVLQEQENQAQRTRLHMINEDIGKINDRNKLIVNKIEQYKAKNEELEQRVLKLMINYEIRRKIGYCFQEDEKYLRSILESFQIELSSPINREIMKQKLNEYQDIVKQYEMNNQLRVSDTNALQAEAYKTQLGSIDGIQNSLREQQKAFKSLIEIINKDLNDLSIIQRDIQA